MSVPEATKNDIECEDYLGNTFPALEYETVIRTGLSKGEVNRTYSAIGLTKRYDTELEMVGAYNARLKAAAKAKAKAEAEKTSEG